MRKTLQTVFFALVLFLPGIALAQSATISGTVTDANGEPIFGANVLIQELTIGGATDIEGRYSFNVPAARVNGQTVTLYVRALSYTQQEKQITLTPGLQTHNFQLRTDVFNLDEVVVTGVAEATPKKKLAFTVETVSAAQLEKAPAADPLSSLQGKIAGATIISSTGEPGSAPSILLRGLTGINTANSPLIIVDGVILSSTSMDFDALDIESIEVVKGAAASSLYGSRAQAGVIQIRTKRGAGLPIGQTRVNIRNEFGRNYLPTYPSLSMHHPFRSDERGWLDASGNPITQDQSGRPIDPKSIAAYALAALEGQTDRIFVDNPYPGPTHNHMEELINPGWTYTNTISVSQNTEATNFRISFSNFHQDGVIYSAHGYDRRGVRMNLDHKISPTIQLSGSGFYSQSFTDRISGTTLPVFYDIMFASPYTSLLARDPVTGKLNPRPDPRGLEDNPLYTIEESETGEERSRVLGNFTARWAPVSWFDLAGSFSYDRGDQFNEEFYDRDYEDFNGVLHNGRYERFHSIDEAMNADFIASVRRTFGDLTLRAQAKAAMESYDLEYTYARGNELSALGTKDLQNAAGDKTVDSSVQQVRSEGYYITGGFDFKGRYIADVLFRRDGSSLFGPESRWNNYYRVSAAYRVSDEPWWFGGDFVNEFKLRYSIGTAGGRPGFTWQYETFSVSNGNISKGNLGNPFLKPELQTEQEFGLELGIANRIFAELVYATSEVKDQLLQIPLPAYTGFANRYENAGTVESNTIEATVNASLLQSRDLSWDLGVVFDRTRGEITDFNRPGYLVNHNNSSTGDYRVFYIRAGEKIGTMYGHRFISSIEELQQAYPNYDPSRFQVNDDGLVVPVGAGGSYTDMKWGTMVDPGSGAELRWGRPLKFLDENGDVVNVIGNVVPDFNLGLNTTFRFKGLTAYMQWNAQVGGDIYNGTKQWTYRNDSSKGGNHGDQDQSGKPDELKKPIDYYADLYNTNSPSSWFVEDGSHVKLREVSLRYAMDRAMLNRLGLGNTLNRVVVSLVGRNLLIFSDYSGFDPEVGGALYRVDQFVYPNYRTVTGVVEIEF